jgi:hypothetical protein
VTKIRVPASLISQLFLTSSDSLLFLHECPKAIELKLFCGVQSYVVLEMIVSQE